MQRTMDADLPSSLDDIRTNAEDLVSTFGDYCPLVSRATTPGDLCLSQSLRLKDSVIATIRNSIEALHEKRRASLESINERKSSLNRDISIVKDDTEAIQEAIEAHAIVANELGHELELDKEIERLQKEISRVRSNVNVLDVQYLKLLQGNLKSAFTSVVDRDTTGQPIDRFGSKLSCIEKLLGLSVCRKDGSIQISFNKISPLEPEKVFTFTIGLVNDMYIPITCTPPVKQFELLIQELNKGLEFGLFLYFMRRAFTKAAQIS
ncbi:bifunctional Kinetochore protein Spc25/Chromosome segregation protein Spc25 [Babesia duncani]|uniref:Kinetochore protein SPC25 n=1 Tax=Babesia duncani TaxID=323732 RepID=A0AAD9UNF5_9APIC|nr:bifunctional Kinetochore protein Spc25/Chromosome segregation protein Spc25 [Babesia duncani]